MPEAQQVQQVLGLSQVAPEGLGLAENVRAWEASSSKMGFGFQWDFLKLPVFHRGLWGFYPTWKWIFSGWFGYNMIKPSYQTSLQNKTYELPVACAGRAVLNDSITTVFKILLCQNWSLVSDGQFTLFRSAQLQQVRKCYGKQHVPSKSNR